MKKICKKLWSFVSAILIVLLVIILFDPKVLGFPDGLLDHLIVILTLLGVMIEQLPRESELRQYQEKLLNYIFNREASTSFWYKLIYIIFLFAVTLFAIYLYTDNKEYWNMAFKLLLLSIPYIIIYYVVDFFHEDNRDLTASAIYYGYLLLIYIAYIANKFISQT
ncbi:hypothetical protein [Mannheimia indoligenes]|uniref:hypothetical protein n=1 Tax=Mannheimia indoligenes TaxID=3103145 RepID=UPI002FE6508A